GAVLPLLGEPRVGLVGEGAVEGEGFVQNAETVLMVRADRVTAPQVPVLVATGYAAPAEDQLSVPGNVLDLLRRGSRGRDERRGRRQHRAGLNKVPPRELPRRHRLSSSSNQSPAPG